MCYFKDAVNCQGDWWISGTGAEQWWNDTDWGSRSTRIKTFPIAILSTTNPFDKTAISAVEASKQLPDLRYGHEWDKGRERKGRQQGKTYQNAAFSHQIQARVICTAWMIHIMLSINKGVLINVKLNAILQLKSSVFTAQYTRHFSITHKLVNLFRNHKKCKNTVREGKLHSLFNVINNWQATV